MRIRTFFKKFIFILLCMVITVETVGCGKVNDSSDSGKKNNEVTATQDENSIVVKNDKLRLEFQKSDGALVSLIGKNEENLGYGLNDGHGSTYGNFTLYVDVATGDKWKTTADRTKLKKISSRGLPLKSSEISDLPSGKRVTLLWDASFDSDGKTYEGITVALTVDVFKDKGYSEWNYSVENNCQGAVVVSIVGAQACGVDPNKDYTLFYPMLEGELHKHAVTLAESSALRAGIDGYTFGVSGARELRVSYPGSLSMQLVQLYNETEGVYIFSKDDAASFKRLNFGIFDENNGYDSDCKAGASLSVEYYPFAENGESVDLPPIVLGAQSSGGWYEGADCYRAFLENYSKFAKNPSKTIREFYGLQAAVQAPTNGAPTFSYDLNAAPDFGNDIATIASSVETLGIDNLMILGWSESGFDAKYPDYKFSEKAGGEAAFKSGVEKARKNGDKIFAYLNAYSVNGDSEWSKSGNLDSCATVREDGTRQVLGWGSYAFTATCPSAENFKKALTEAAERLAKNGVNGLFFDQLMEMPAELCFNKAHGHKTPATAYGEGYKKIFEEIDAIMRKYTDDYAFFCEGINDAYAPYIDMAGLMWSRPLGYKLNKNDTDGEDLLSAPEITRYTIPVKVLGLWNDDAASMSANEYSLAYLMGNPILRQGGTTNPVIKKYIEVYKSYPDIFEKGVFTSSKGVKTTEEVTVGVLKGENRFIVNVYNPTDKAISLSIETDIAKLGYSGIVDSVENVFDKGNYKRFKNNSFNLDVEAYGLASYIITIRSGN